jgi:hypothetical protein
VQSCEQDIALIRNAPAIFLMLAFPLPLSGQATADPTIPLVKSRRRIKAPKVQEHADTG